MDFRGWFYLMCNGSINAEFNLYINFVPDGKVLSETIKLLNVKTMNYLIYLRYNTVVILYFVIINKVLHAQILVKN